MARKIEDTGVKVGGARKEKVISRTVTTTKKESLPAWLPKKVDVAIASEKKRYSTSSRYKSFGEGEWAIFDYGLIGVMMIAGGFQTREEAIEQLPYLFWEKVLSLRQTNDNKWGIFKRMRTAHALLPCKTGFASREEAFLYAKEHAPELVATRTLNPVLPKIKTIQREGPDYRLGRDITGEELCATFGLCGVEFGEWLPDKERQASLNCCYDAFADLARVLRVDRRSIGFNGLLAVAFGSRGVSNFLAHFEPMRFVFNLTRMKGAGSVAHEWFHAFDYYIGARERGIVLDRKDPDLYKKTPSVPAMSSLIYKEGVFRDLIYGLKYRYASGEEAAQILEGQLEKQKNDIRIAKEDYIGAVTAQHLRQPATGEEIARLMGLLDHLDDWVEDLKLFYSEYGEFESLYARVRGWRCYKIERGNECSHLKDYLLGYISIQKGLRNPDRKVCLGASQYMEDARRIDHGRSKSYWATELEMAARAFGAFVEDSLDDEGNLSQFLVHSHKNEVYEDCKPYPEGEERKMFRKLFDRLFQEIRI